MLKTNPSDLLLTTKLYAPRVDPRLVSRPRLVDRLDQCFERRLCLLSAPAGFGKTTLVSAWIATGRIPIAWLSLDEHDNDPVRFWRYVIAALQTVEPGIGESALTVLQSSQPTSVESFLPSLVNDLSGISEDFALVLDDYHLITSGPIHAALRFLLDHLPSQMHVLITTRSDPPLPLPRLRARGQVLEIRAGDLRCTGDEAAAFLTETMGLSLAPEEMTALHERTEGWIAGLQLAGLALQGQTDTRTFIAEFTGSHRYIAEYLLEDVVRRLPDRVQSFLLETAILGRLTGPLCDFLTGEENGEEMLAELERANLFLTPLDGQQRWYRYHRLFADLLRYQLQQQGAEQVRALHCRAAAWYEQQAQAPSPESLPGESRGPPPGWNVALATEAIEHALAAQDWKRAVHVIESIAGIITWRRGEGESLHRWLAALPDEIVYSRPKLCLVRAWALLWGGQLDAVDSLLRDVDSYVERRITEHHSGQPDTSEAENARESLRAIRGEAAAIGAELAQMRGDLTRSFALSRRALEDLAPGEQVLRGIVAAVQGDAHAATGNVLAAIPAYQEASASLERTDKLIPALISRGHLVRLQAMQGQLHQAARSFETARRLAEARGLERSPAIALATVWMGDILREWNDLGAAREHLHSGIALGQQWVAMAEHIAAGAISLARVHEAAGDVESAHQVLEEQLQRLDGSGAAVVSQLGAYRARLWLAEGKVAAASQWLRDRTLEPDDEPTFQREAELLVLARVLLSQREWDRAARVLMRVRNAAEAWGRLRIVIEILLLQALSCDGRGDPSRASALLGQALMVAEPGSYVRIFLDEGAPIATLLRRLVPSVSAPQYLDRLLAAFDEQACTVRPATGTLAGEQSPRVGMPALIEPLSERELEVLRLINAGRSNREIARELIVTVGTVKKHINNIFGKLEVQSRTQAVARSRELGLLP